MTRHPLPATRVAGYPTPMATPGFDIIVNGVPRTFRDREDVALEAARTLKHRDLNSIVELVSTETGARAVIPDVVSPPAWSGRA